MEHKYLFGSKMLKLSNNRDEDWLTFVDEQAKVANELGCKSIPFYQTLINFFIRGRNIKPDMFSGLFLYQLSAPFIEEENYPFKDFNILEYKEVWKQWLKAYVASEQNEAWATKENVLPKQFYHLLYQYHMITENAHWISDEAKIDVQKIHDLEMHSSYFYKLRELINDL